MALNEIMRPGWKQSVVCSAPAAPDSGDPVLYGFLTGVALTDEGGGGNIATETTVDFGPAVWDLPVTDAVGGGIAVGATLFLDAAAVGVSNDSSGLFFGFALEAVGVGATATINVLHVPSPGSGIIGAGTIATANLAAGIISANAAGRALFAAGVFDAATWAAAFADGIIAGAKLATVANANVIGGVPVLHRINVAGGAAGNTDVVLTHKTRILDVWAVHTAAGEANDTIQVFNGAAAVSDAMDWSGADKALVRAGEIDDAGHEVAAGGTLRVTTTDDDAGGDVGAGVVYVLGIRVA
jgi:predicted RecA/RadA family phage recombinase